MNRVLLLWGDIDAGWLSKDDLPLVRGMKPHVAPLRPEGQLTLDHQSVWAYGLGLCPIVMMCFVLSD